jgi:hypothetical protein
MGAGPASADTGIASLHVPEARLAGEARFFSILDLASKLSPAPASGLVLTLLGLAGSQPGDT